SGGPPSPTRTHQERENNKWGCGSDRRFLPLRYHCVMKPLFVSFQVSALIRGSLPRPWGEGGPPSGGPGEGQPARIAPQNVQTPDHRLSRTHLLRLPRPPRTKDTIPPGGYRKL